MQNIDPILFIGPSIALAASLGIVLYWWRGRGFRGTVLILGAAAYFLAIIAKVVLDYFLAGPVTSDFGTSSLEYAAYLGLETVVFEVGFAYAFAIYGVRRRGLKPSDAVPLGLSLAFWENGVLLGAFALIEYGAIYYVLSRGLGAAQTVYSQLMSAEPAYFYSPAALLPSVLLGSLERFSSILAHTAWGALCVLAAVTGKKRYLAYALPMGLLDSLVPFGAQNIDLFEAVVFVLSLSFVVVAAKSIATEKNAESAKEDLRNPPRPTLQ